LRSFAIGSGTLFAVSRAGRIEEVIASWSVELNVGLNGEAVINANRANGKIKAHPDGSNFRT